MKKYRTVITYKDYFDNFFKAQPQKVRDKIIKVLDIIENIERIPVTEKDTKNSTERNRKGNKTDG